MSAPAVPPRPAFVDPLVGDISGDIPSEGRISPIPVLNTLLKYRYLILITAVGFAAFFAIRALTRPRTYTAVVAFMAHTPNEKPSGGLAEQLGINIGGSSTADGPAFYVDLLKRRSILWEVASHQYSFMREGRQTTGTFAEIHGIRAANPAAVRHRAASSLSSAIDARIAKTGIVEVSVTQKYPDLASQIAMRLVEALNRFNLESRQSQATVERLFVERRLAEAAADLRSAENRLEDFLEQNRDFGSSPRLAFGRQRLEREVAMRQELYTSLAKSLDQAKIEQVRDSPVITVMEAAEPPLVPNPRWTVRQAVLGFFAGFVLGVVAAFLVGYLRSSLQRESVDAQEFIELKRQAIDDLLHPMRAARRLVRA